MPPLLGVPPKAIDNPPVLSEPLIPELPPIDPGPGLLLVPLQAIPVEMHRITRMKSPDVRRLMDQFSCLG
jgi:hypothetical protein